MRFNESSTLLTTACALGLMLLCGSPASAQDSEGPASITLQGIVRDFKDRNAEGGHPDFQRQPSSGFGHYVGMVADELDSQGKPVFGSCCTKQNVSRSA